MNVTNKEESEDVLYDIREREFDFFINFAMPYLFLALGTKKIKNFFLKQKIKRSLEHLEIC